ncbi:hypothetical protein K402DRAFT_399099 [Aulographum hederae CBS 113979]|uniref:Uncharacterized protein n=1 Tax=Aulographum hederae CBS 113979 TaxID=1176131 RepID=A0A6G1GIT9_9PEZI|nr:hypothetical protein K402DRAFT_399099 [Aulographum hederae CBS 113979]
MALIDKKQFQLTTPSAIQTHWGMPASEVIVKSFRPTWFADPSEWSIRQLDSILKLAQYTPNEPLRALGLLLAWRRHQDKRPRMPRLESVVIVEQIAEKCESEHNLHLPGIFLPDDLPMGLPLRERNRGANVALAEFCWKKHAESWFSRSIWPNQHVPLRWKADIVAAISNLAEKSRGRSDIGIWCVVDATRDRVTRVAVLEAMDNFLALPAIPDES